MKRWFRPLTMTQPYNAILGLPTLQIFPNLSTAFSYIS